MRDHFPARLSIVHMLPSVAAAHGVDHRPIMAAVGLDADTADWRGDIVARARIASLLGLLARKTGDETLGLELALAADLEALGPAGLALGSGKTLGEALQAHIRHMPSLQGGLDYRLVADDGNARILHRYRAGRAEDSRVMSEGVAAFIVRAIREMAGDPELTVRIALPHRPRVPVRLYEDRLQAAVIFQPSDTISVSFDARHLARINRARRGMDSTESRPLAKGDTVLDDRDYVEALRRMCAPAALAGRLTLTQVAEMLGLAPRSMQRRLAVLGMDFRGLVDDWRRQESTRLLLETAMPVGDVGRILGYSDPAHFTRAFHRWHGTTPAGWRRRPD